MKKVFVVILLSITIVSFSQEYQYQTSIKLDSLIWTKINEYRASDSAILYGNWVPNVIKVFALGDWREFAYDISIKHSKAKDIFVNGHTDPEELASRGITGENLAMHWYHIKETDLTDEATLDRIATAIVVGWINSHWHKVVLRWMNNEESCVTSVITKQPRILDKYGEYGGEDYYYQIMITYQTKDNDQAWKLPPNEK